MAERTLELDGYIFQRVSNNLNKDGSTGWRCRAGKKGGMGATLCPASCRIGQDGEILRYRDSHNHPKATQEELDFIRLKNELKQKLKTEPGNALKIIESVKRKSVEETGEDRNFSGKRRKSTHCVERTVERFKPNEDFNQTISFGSGTMFTPTSNVKLESGAKRGRRTKTQKDEEENMNYENFAESIPNSFSGNFTSTTRKGKHILVETDKEWKVPFSDVTNKKIAKKKNLNKIIIGLQGKDNKTIAQKKSVLKSGLSPVQEKFGKMGKRKDLNIIINGLWLKKETIVPN